MISSSTVYQLFCNLIGQNTCRILAHAYTAGSKNILAAQKQQEFYEQGKGMNLEKDQIQRKILLNVLF